VSAPKLIASVSLFQGRRYARDTSFKRSRCSRSLLTAKADSVPVVCTKSTKTSVVKRDLTRSRNDASKTYSKEHAFFDIIEQSKHSGGSAEGSYTNHQLPGDPTVVKEVLIEDAAIA
jgi:hypothetical protein